MGLITAPSNTPVWVNVSRCKACDICVSMCPAGVLAMVQAPNSTLGSMIEVVAPDAVSDVGIVNYIVLILLFM